MVCKLSLCLVLVACGVVSAKPKNLLNYSGAEARDGPKCSTPGWVTFESHCYLFSHNKAAWYAAAYRCKEGGAKLVSIKSQAEEDFIKANIKGNTWLGMTDRKGEGNWFWIDDGSPVTYTNWATGEPNGGTTENYGIMWESGEWNDLYPYGLYHEYAYYICKK